MHKDSCSRQNEISFGTPHKYFQYYLGRSLKMARDREADNELFINRKTEQLIDLD